MMQQQSGGLQKYELWLLMGVCAGFGVALIVVGSDVRTLNGPAAIIGGLLGAGLAILVGRRLTDELGSALLDRHDSERQPHPITRPFGPPAGVIVFAFATFVAASTGYGSIDAVLHALHQPGDASLGSEALTPPVGSPVFHHVQISEAASIWARDLEPRNQAENTSVLDTRRLVAAMLLLDSLVLVPSYVYLLVVIVGAARKLLQAEGHQITETASVTLFNAYLRLHGTAIVFVLIAGCADWLENGFAMLALDQAWPAQPASGSLNTCVGSCAVLAGFQSVFTWLKAIGIVVALAYALLVALLAFQHGGDGARTWVRFPKFRALVLRLALPVGVLIAVYFLVLGNQQAPDVLRRWTHPGEELGVIVAGIVLTVLLGLVIAWSSWWLLLDPERVVHREKRRGLPGSLEGQLTPTGWWFAGVAGLWYACVWGVGWWAVDGTAGWVGAIFLAGGFGVVLAHPKVREKLGWSRWAIPLLVLAFVIAIAEWVFSGQWQVLVPFAIIGASLPLGYPLRAWPEAEPEPFAQFRYLPGFMAATVSLVIGTGLLASGLDVTVYHIWRREFPTDALVLLICGGLLIGVVPPFIAGRLYQLTQTGLLNWMHDDGARKYGVALSAGALVLGTAVWLLVISVLSEDIGRIFLTDKIGLLAVLCFALILVTLSVAGLVTVVEEAFPLPPPLYRMFGATRTGVVPILGLWLVINAVFSLPEAAHNVRLDGPDPKPTAARESIPTIVDKFKQWQSQQCINSTDTPTGGDPATIHGRPVRPLILVATEGGGIRAAAWTIYVLDRTFGYGSARLCSPGQPATSPRDSSWIFAMSGISGGSVGLATYAARQGFAEPLHPAPDWPTMADAEAKRGQPSPTTPGWVRTYLSRDGLTPVVTWMLLIEGQWSLLHYPLHRDRAAVLEDVFETWPADPEATGASVPSQKLFQLQQTTRVPLLLLNGTSVESGCRFNGSVARSVGNSTQPELPLTCITPADLRVASPQTAPATPRPLPAGVTDQNLGATVDLVDYVCAGEDIHLMSAALLSARFPYVSPSGALQQCGNGPPETRPWTFVVDGGYNDGSGMATALEVWSSIAPLVADYNARANSPVSLVPVLVQIDNGYGEPVGPGATPMQPQVLVPPATFLATRSAIDARARQAGQIAFQEVFRIAAGLQFCGPRYVHFALRAHPGPAAPLGWALSDLSFDDLVRQLGSPVMRDAESRVSNWLDPGWMADHVVSNCTTGGA